MSKLITREWTAFGARWVIVYIMNHSYRWQLLACLWSTGRSLAMVSKQQGGEHIQHQHSHHPVPPSCTLTHGHTRAHAHTSTCIINKLTTACDAKQQHAVALLTSPASGHRNDSFFFLPANVIDTHAEETGRGCLSVPACLPACLPDFPRRNMVHLRRGESC